MQRAAQVLAGYSLGQADLLRRAMGKKKPEVLAKEFVPFQAGCRERGYSDEAIQAVWDVLVPFAGYAFNKSHSAALRPGLLLDRLPEGELPGRVHGRAAHLGGRRQGQGRASTWPRPARSASGCCRRTSTSRSPTSPPSATTCGSGSRRVRNVGAQRHRLDGRDPQGEGQVQLLRGLPRQGRRSPRCNKRAIESLIKAGRVRLARTHPARAVRRARERDRRRHRRSRSRRPSGRTTCSARWTPARVRRRDRAGLR